MMRDISVLLPVYHGDDKIKLRKTAQSIFNQTVQPNEVIIGIDGDIPNQLAEEIQDWKSKYEDRVNYFQNDQNMGLGATLRKGVKECSNDLIARIDADDQSVPSRLERQLSYMHSNPELDVVGGYMADKRHTQGEFSEIRKVPSSHQDILRMGKYRNPLNHPTVMMRKSAVLSAGNYSDLRYIQDYELWGRMLNEGYRFANIPVVLSFATSDNTENSDSLSQRRGGMEYIQYEITVNRKLHSEGFLTKYQALRNVLSRIPVRLIPSGMRERVYKTLLRDNSS